MLITPDKPGRCFICNQHHWATEDCPEKEVACTELNLEVEVKGNPSQNPEPLSHAEPTPISNPPEENVIGEVLSQVERNRKWRENNPEKYQAQQERYKMKRRRNA